MNDPVRKVLDLTNKLNKYQARLDVCNDALEKHKKHCLATYQTCKVKELKRMLVKRKDRLRHKREELTEAIERLGHRVMVLDTKVREVCDDVG